MTCKFLSLGLLLVCPMALARVQLHTQAEIKNSPRYGDCGTDMEFELDLNESVEICNEGDIRIIAKLLTEKEEVARVSFSVYDKNSAGEYEEIASPELVVNYNDSVRARVAMSSYKNHKKDEGESFSVTIINAQKV